MQRDLSFVAMQPAIKVVGKMIGLGARNELHREVAGQMAVGTRTVKELLVSIEACVESDIHA